MSSTTLSAVFGMSSAGIFLPTGSSTYLSGIKPSQIGTSSSSSVLGDFTCSAGPGSDLITGYGKITSVQPGYITVNSPNRGNVNLRIGGCSRLEANRPNFVASTYDNVFFRGRPGSNKDVHLYDLTCLS